MGIGVDLARKKKFSAFSSEEKPQVKVFSTTHNTTNNVTPIKNAAGGKKQKTLSNRQLAFIDLYVRNGNASGSAFEAGYTHVHSGFQLLKNPLVAAEVSKQRAKAQSKVEITADWIAAQYKRIAMADPRNLYNPDGSLKMMHELDDDTALSLDSYVPPTIDPETGKQKSAGRARKMDALRALDALAKWQKMFGEEGTRGEGVTVRVVGGLPATEGPSIEGTVINVIEDQSDKG